MTKLKCLLKNESCLWHWTLGCVHKQYNTVYHFKNTLYLSTEISMARGVDNVYLNVLRWQDGVPGRQKPHRQL